MGNVYPEPWTGVAVCCCRSCGGHPRCQGYAGSFSGVRLWLGYGGVWHKNPGSSVVSWRADWTVGSQELVLVNTYAPSKFYVMFFSLYCIIVSRFTNTFFDCFNIFIGPLCKH